MPTPKRGDFLVKAVAANQILTEGLSEAVQQGYGSFASNFSQNPNFNQVGFDNPLLKGSLQGWISFLDRAARAWYDASRDFLK